MTETSNGAGWIQAVSRNELKERKRVVFRYRDKQIVLFYVKDAVYAVDNRCPHEGYPLREGTIDEESCRLTCQWHNWKFELPTGKNVLGEDHVRSYPTRFENGQISVLVIDPPVEEIQKEILRGFRTGVERRQYGRIAREISRLLVAGIDPRVALQEAVKLSFDRLEFGTTHAYAVTTDWLRLYEQEDERARKVVCLTEAIDHIADDVLREPRFPYRGEPREFDGPRFLDAVEKEDEERAVGMIRGALQDGMGWEELEPWFSRAALMHYNDFGHAAIYVYKTGPLLAYLGQDHTELLLLPLTRMILYCTREDLLPDFRHYKAALAACPPAGGEYDSWHERNDVFGLSARAALAWVTERLAQDRPRVLYSTLMEACARNLLGFVSDHERATNQPVSRNVNFLSFTHALTFANAARHLCQKDPELWPKALLQMACFAGRNKAYVDKDADVSPWLVDDRRAFSKKARDKILDHGLSDPIFPAHLVKTSLAVEEELDAVSPGCAVLLLAALNRFLSASLKQKHTLRTARQALSLVTPAPARAPQKM